MTPILRYARPPYRLRPWWLRPLAILAGWFIVGVFSAAAIYLFFFQQQHPLGLFMAFAAGGVRWGCRTLLDDGDL